MRKPFFDSLRGQRVAFIGAGVAHKDLLPLFVAAGARVTLCDMKTKEDFGPFAQQLEAQGVCLSLGQSYLDGLAQQDMILRTPGFEYFTPELQAAKASGAHITSEVELFLEHAACRLVGITGSDGKTTSSSLIAELYKEAGFTVHLGGNIGRALLPIVDEVKEQDIAVVELSSFQLISMRVSPAVALVTNVTPNHLDHHKDMQEYVDAKRNILLYQTKKDLAVLGYENEITRKMQEDVKGECRWFSRLQKVSDGAFLNEDGMLCIAKNEVASPVLHQSEVRLPGVHNVENMLAAFAVVQDEVSQEAMRKVAQTFAGVEHRIEPVRTVNGVRWYNDSIATSPTRVIAGLRAFSQKLVVIAGGYDKKIPFEPMVEDMLKSVRLLVLMGATAPKIEAALRASSRFSESGIVILHADGLPMAVELAAQNAHAGDIVTLSPACASFDAYPNFEARGRHFKELVNAL